MTNQEHLEILRKGVEAWNRWRAENPVIPNLQEADLRGTNLQEAILWLANLQEANLRVASLQEANLRVANLQEANLWGTNLWGANLQGAILWGANLQGADLGGATFDENTMLPDGTKWTPGTDMGRFTDREHPDFWRSDDPASPAYRGGQLE